MDIPQLEPAAGGPAEGVVFEEAPDLNKVLADIWAGRVDAHESRKDMTRQALRNKINSLQRSLRLAVGWQNGGWNQEADRRLRDWLLTQKRDYQRAQPGQLLALPAPADEPPPAEPPQAETGDDSSSGDSSSGDSSSGDDNDTGTEAGNNGEHRENAMSDRDGTEAGNDGEHRENATSDGGGMEAGNDGERCENATNDSDNNVASMRAQLVDVYNDLGVTEEARLDAEKELERYKRSHDALEAENKKLKSENDGLRQMLGRLL